jgi:hypothetical protein
LSEEHRPKHKQPALTEEQQPTSTKLDEYRSPHSIDDDEDDGYGYWESGNEEVESEELLHKVTINKTYQFLSNEVIDNTSKYQDESQMSASEELRKCTNHHNKTMTTYPNVEATMEDYHWWKDGTKMVVRGEARCKYPKVYYVCACKAQEAARLLFHFILVFI